MADLTLSPNMSMPVPTVSLAPGSTWATDINASLSIIDSHNHSPGQGVQINPAGLNINTDLAFNNNNATVVRSVNFNSQGSPLGLSTDIGCVYVSGVDLYYNDENGNQIRITQSGSVAGSAGTITGLPSGTASASFSAGTFTFQGATNTPASINVGPIVLGNAVANSKTVTISPDVGIAANYNLSLPAALPAALNYVTLDNSGNLSFNNAGLTGSGAVVLQTSPTFPSGIGFTSGTMLDYQDGTWTPTCIVTAGSGTVSPSPGRFQRVGNVVICRIILPIPQTAFSFSMTLPILPASNFSSSDLALGIGHPPSTNGGACTISALSGQKLVQVAASVPSGSPLQSTIFMYNLN